MALDKETILKVLAGKGTKREQMVLLAIAFVIYWSGIAYAQIVFPGNYSILNNHISDQGGIVNNPDGFDVFGIAFILTGFLLIPNFLWLRQRLLPTFGLLSNIATVCLIIGGIGLSGVGAFPQDNPAIHEPAADLAFGGLGLGAFLIFFISLRKMQQRAGWPKAWQFILSYTPVLLFGTLMILFQVGTLTAADPRFSDWPFWQWTLMLSILFWMAVTFFAADAEPSNFPPNP